MRINPGVALIQPDFKVAVLAPCRCRRLDDLLRGMRRQVLARGCERELSFISRFADEHLQEARSFKPPVSEQFGIEWDQYVWIKSCHTDFADLESVLVDKISSLDLRDICLVLRHVILLF